MTNLIYLQGSPGKKPHRKGKGGRVFFFWATLYKESVPFFVGSGPLKKINESFVFGSVRAGYPVHWAIYGNIVGGC